jgi:cysteine desulfurase
MRDRLYNGLKDKLKNIRLNGHPEKRLPNTLSLSFKDIDTNILLSEIKENVAVSAGAACHTGKTEISYVLEAMGIPIEFARGTIRFSTGRMTTVGEIDSAINIIVNTIIKIKSKSKGLNL